MATKVEKERAKERQLMKIEKKIDQIIKMLRDKEITLDLSSEESESVGRSNGISPDEILLDETKNPKSPKKVKNEK